MTNSHAGLDPPWPASLLAEILGRVRATWPADRADERPLTVQQWRLLRLIVLHHVVVGEAPTISCLARHLGICHTNVRQRIGRLAALGYLRHDAGAPVPVLNGPLGDFGRAMQTVVLDAGFEVGQQVVRPRGRE